MTVYDVLVELYYDDDWQDITSYVRNTDPIRIKRGFSRLPARGMADPQTASFQLDNTDGRFSPRNPRSPLYGKIGQNTPVRITCPYDGVNYRRFTGEISEWPVEWNKPGTIVSAPITASGPSRRFKILGALKSALTRTLADPNNGLDTTAFWPMEEGATVMTPGNEWGSGLAGEPSMKVIYGQTGTQLTDGWLGCLPLPTFGTAGAYGVVTPAGDGTSFTVWLNLYIPETISGNTRILRVYTESTASGLPRRFDLTLTTAGAFNYSVDEYDDSNLTSGTIGFSLTQGYYRLQVDASVSGGTVTVNVSTLEQGESTGGAGDFTFSASTIGRVIAIQLADGSTDTVGLGQVHVSSEVLSLFDAADQLAGFQGEDPRDRFERICGILGVPADYIFGGGETGVELGAEPVGSAADILNDLASVEGVVHDARSTLDLVWRGDGDRVNPALLTLDYTASEIYEFKLVDDDELSLNDSTITRSGGASARITVDVGARSTQDPPDGIGRYDESKTLNLGNDSQPASWANYRTVVGTVDEARIDALTVNLTDDEDLLYRVMTADSGNPLDIFDVITITDLPDWLPPTILRGSIVGYEEEITQFTWKITYSCEPQSPYDAVILNDPDDIEADRVDSASSELASGITSNTTSLSVASDDDDLWNTSGIFPVDINVGPERMRVTAISGSTSPQTFTVTRGINGYTQAHDSGATVALSFPRRLNRP